MFVFLLSLFIALTSLETFNTAELNLLSRRNALSLSSESVVIVAMEDATISEKEPDTNYGAVPFFNANLVGKDSTGKRFRTLISFNLSGIPSGSKILSAKLKVYCLAPTGTTPKVKVHRAINLWMEMVVTWNLRAVLKLKPSPWLPPVNVPFYWDTPGGDYSFSVEASKSITGGSVAVPVEFDLTNLVKKWLDGTYYNYGILLEADASPNNVMTLIAQREHPNSDYKPKLIVKYTPPSITLTPNPSTQTVHVGETALYTFMVTSTTSPGQVTLSVTGLPTETTYVFSNNELEPPFSTTLTVYTSVSTPPGDYPLTIHASSTSGVPGVTGVLLSVLPTEIKDFDLSVTPPTLTVKKGEKAVFAVEIAKIGTLTSPVSLRVSGLPEGSTYSFSDNNLAPPFTSKLMVQTSASTPTGDFFIDVQGVSGSIVHIRTVTLTVSEQPDFEVSIPENTVTVESGKKGYLDVYITPKGGFKGSFVFMIQGLPGDVKVKSSMGIPTGTGQDKYVLTFTAGATTGTFHLTITAKSSELEHSVPATLIITAPTGVTPTPTPSPSPTPTPTPTAPSEFDFSLKVTPISLSIKQGETATLAVEIGVLSGKGYVYFDVTGLPPDASFNFNPATLKAPGTTILTVNTGSTTGTFTVLITGHERGGRGLTRTATFTLIIEEKPGFIPKCIIATVTYGSELSSEVSFLRKFRGEVILSSFAGENFLKVFNAFYYSFSPQVAEVIASNELLRSLMKIFLYPLIGLLQISAFASQPLSTLSHEAASVVAGFIASLLIGLIYFTPISTLIKWLIERRVKLSFNTKKILKPLSLATLFSLATLVLGVYILNEALTMFSSSLFVVSTITLTTVSTAVYIKKTLFLSILRAFKVR